uniref:Uncharacterized protein n=1 Tax=Solanum lycopersicum TaxID=4081 RepID=A0A3Q7IYK4_SOLLC
MCSCKPSFFRNHICENCKSNSICSLTDHLGKKITKDRILILSYPRLHAWI